MRQAKESRAPEAHGASPYVPAKSPNGEKRCAVQLAEWLRDVEYDFMKRWPEQVTGSGIPDGLHAGIAHGIGDLDLQLIHPLEGAGTSLLAVTGDAEAVLIRFDPPETTQIMFLGLRGGVYTETIWQATSETPNLEGEYAHEQLGAHGPLRVRYYHPAPSDLNVVEKGAFDRSKLLRETFRDWASVPVRRPEQA
jgi:hypothetical protein